MKRSTLLPLLIGAVLAVYFWWLGATARDCYKRGGIPVPLPTGTQCAAKLGQKVP